MGAVRTDIVLFGGGIAGLWLLGRLREAGYSAILLESAALGGVQTIASQGIIHGGTKYALTGKLTESTRAIGEMPQVWRDCLAGRGALDLSRVQLLSDHQYLWSSESLLSRMTGFFASKAMQSRMTPVEGSKRPEPFNDPAFRGSLYRLDEPVLDVASLISELIRQYGDHCFSIDTERLAFEALGSGETRITLSATDRIEARRIVLAAGSGNAALLEKLGRNGPEMQLRPLHMVMARGNLPPLYAHCLGVGATPRVTITSYPAPDGRTVWYIGGQLAEAGVESDSDELIEAARKELKAALPWLDLSGVEWSCLRVDRAEPKIAGGGRPDSYFLDSREGVITIWPTKLAFAPRLADALLAKLDEQGVAPSNEGALQLEALPRPTVAQLPWEEMEQWS
jgi:glycerol-3-phosphate dehydrogenase